MVETFFSFVFETGFVRVVIHFWLKPGRNMDASGRSRSDLDQRNILCPSENDQIWYLSAIFTLYLRHSLPISFPTLRQMLFLPFRHIHILLFANIIACKGHDNHLHGEQTHHRHRTLLSAPPHAYARECGGHMNRRLRVKSEALTQHARERGNSPRLIQRPQSLSEARMHSAVVLRRAKDPRMQLAFHFTNTRRTYKNVKGVEHVQYGV